MPTKFKNFIIVETLGDGNCLYNAYAISLMCFLRTLDWEEEAKPILQKGYGVDEEVIHELKEIHELSFKEMTQRENKYRIQHKLSPELRRIASENAVTYIQQWLLKNSICLKEVEPDLIQDPLVYPAVQAEVEYNLKKQLLREYNSDTCCCVRFFRPPRDENTAALKIVSKQKDVYNDEVFKMKNFKNSVKMHVNEAIKNEKKRLLYGLKSKNKAKEKVKFLKEEIDKIAKSFIGNENWQKRYKKYLNKDKRYSAGTEVGHYLNTAFHDKNIKNYLKLTEHKLSVLNNGINIYGYGQPTTGIILLNINNAHWKSCIPIQYTFCCDRDTYDHQVKDLTYKLEEERLKLNEYDPVRQFSTNVVKILIEKLNAQITQALMMDKSKHKEEKYASDDIKIKNLKAYTQLTVIENIIKNINDSTEKNTNKNKIKKLCEKVKKFSENFKHYERSAIYNWLNVIEPDFNIRRTLKIFSTCNKEAYDDAHDFRSEEFGQTPLSDKVSALTNTLYEKSKQTKKSKILAIATRSNGEFLPEAERKSAFQENIFALKQLILLKKILEEIKEFKSNGEENKKIRINQLCKNLKTHASDYPCKNIIAAVFTIASGLVTGIIITRRTNPDSPCYKFLYDWEKSSMIACIVCVVMFLLLFGAAWKIKTKEKRLTDQFVTEALDFCRKKDSQASPRSPHS